MEMKVGAVELQSEEDKKELGELEGFVLLKFPKYTERLKLMKECKFKSDSEGNVEISSDNIDSAIKMIEVVAKYVVQVELKHPKSGAVAKSFSELEDHYSFESAITVIGSKILSGGKPGNG